MKRERGQVFALKYLPSIALVIFVLPDLAGQLYAVGAVSRNQESPELSLMSPLRSHPKATEKTLKEAEVARFLCTHLFLLSSIHSRNMLHLRRILGTELKKPLCHPSKCLWCNDIYTCDSNWTQVMLGQSKANSNAFIIWGVRFSREKTRPWTSQFSNHQHLGKDLTHTWWAGGTKLGDQRRVHKDSAAQLGHEWWREYWFVAETEGKAAPGWGTAGVKTGNQEN